MGVIYKPNPIFMSPNNSSINPSVNNDVELIIYGKTCLAYRFNVYDLDNNAITPPSTNRVDLATTLYDGETLTVEITAGDLTAGNDYKYQFDLYGNDLVVSSIDTTTDILTVSNHNLITGDTVFIQSDTTLPTGTSAFTSYYIRKISTNEIALYETYESASSDGDKVDITTTGSGVITMSNVITSQQIKFSAYSAPSFVLSSIVIGEQSYEFTPVYSQSENVLVNNFQAFLYDDDDKLIEEGELKYSSNVKYTFDGLTSGETYKVKFTGETDIGQVINTGLVSFDVVYLQPELDIGIEAKNNYVRASNTITWSELVQIIGTIDGSYSWVSDFVSTDNTALELYNGTTLTYNNLDISNEHTNCFLWKPSSASYDGKIIRFRNTTTGSYMTIGYDQSVNAFYREIDGLVLYNSEYTLVLDNVYLIASTNLSLYIINYE